MKIGQKNIEKEQSFLYLSLRRFIHKRNISKENNNK